jgi:hypothetical protein
MRDLVQADNFRAFCLDRPGRRALGLSKALNLAAITGRQGSALRGNPKILSLPLGHRGFFLASFTDAIPRQAITKGKTMSDNKTPAAKVTLYPVTAAIWRNDNNAKGDAFYSVTFERSYKDEKGNWKSSKTFNAGDLLLLAKVADQAHTEIHNLRANDRQAEQPDEDAA